MRCRCGFFWGHWRSLFTRTLSLCTLSFSFPSLPPMRACVRACVCVCVRAARSRARSAVWQGPRRRCRGGSRACATDLPTSQRFVAQRLCVEFRGGQNKKLYIYKLPINRFCGPILHILQLSIAYAYDYIHSYNTCTIVTGGPPLHSI